MVISDMIHLPKAGILVFLYDVGPNSVLWQLTNFSVEEEKSGVTTVQCNKQAALYTEMSKVLVKLWENT